MAISISLLRAGAAFLFLSVAAQALGQTTVTLQQGLNGYSGTTDARIGAFNPSMNFGGNSTMFLAEESQHSLFVRFAIFAAEGGPVPDNAVITSAMLSLYKFWGPAAVIKSSRVKPAWNEMEVTWDVAAAGAAWQTAGALGANDVEATPDGEGSVGDAAGDGCSDQGVAPAACWLNIDVTSGVQAFLTGAPNQGWKLAYVSGGVASDEKDFVSSENSNSGLRPKLTVTYTVCPPGPFGGTPRGAGEIEAEDFDCGGEGVGYHDTTSGNQSNSLYRDPESVDLMDMGPGARTVQYFNTSEWMNYTVSVPAGTYSLAIFAAHNATPGQYRIEIDGVDVTGNVTVPGTGSWDVYQWVQAPGAVTLAEGAHVVRLVSVQQAFRVDKIRLETTSPPAQCEDPPQRPFTGGPILIPSGGGTFEAENYDCGGQGTAYHDTTSGNEFGSTYRPGESVDIWDIPEGGQVVRNFNTAEWLEYTVNVAVAGAYRLGIRAGHNETPGQYRIEVDGNDATGNVTVPGTGSWDVYQWVDSPTTVNLGAGTHVLRLVSVQQAYRVEKLRVIPVGTQTIDTADIIHQPRANIPFAGQSTALTGHVQVYGTGRPLNQVPESGITGTNTAQYGNVRFGKQANPVNANQQVFAFMVAPGDPDTNGQNATRGEFSFSPTVEWEKTYWMAVRAYVHDWGTLPTNDDALFAMQMHTEHAIGLGPIFGIYEEEGRKFRVYARTHKDLTKHACGNVRKMVFPDPEEAPAISIPFGQWIEFVVKFRHSLDNGLFQVWMNGNPIVNHQAAYGFENSTSCNKGERDYPKFGYYNWTEGPFDGSGIPRKVLLHSPLLIKDFDASSSDKYTLGDIRTFVSQQP